MTQIKYVTESEMVDKTGVNSLGYALPKEDTILIREGMPKEAEKEVKRHEFEHIKNGEEGPFWAQVITAVVAAKKSRDEKKAAQGAAAAQERAAMAGIEEQRGQFQLTREQQQPFIQAGTRAVEQQQALLGLSGQEAQQKAMEQFQESPGQQFIRQRQERALLRNQAAIGGLGGGNIRTALQQQAAGFAQTDLQNQLAQLAGLSGRGQTAVTNVGQFGAQQASNIGNLLTQGGAAQASGILGAQQARSQFAGQLQGGLQGGTIGQQTPGVGFGQGFAAGFMR